MVAPQRIHLEQARSFAATRTVDRVLDGRRSG